MHTSMKEMNKILVPILKVKIVLILRKNMLRIKISSLVLYLGRYTRVQGLLWNLIAKPPL